MKCIVCKGTGLCQVCGGTGKVEWGTKASGMPMITGGAPGSSKDVPCPRCKGTGDCSRCHGTGQV